MIYEHLSRGPGRPKMHINFGYLSRLRGRPVIPIKRKRNTLEQNLGALITEMRTARRWSQKDLEDRTGYSNKFLGRVERGLQNPRLGFMVKVAHAFGLRPSQFFALLEKQAKR